MQKALEEKRNEKVIGASLEAHVTLRASGETFALLSAYEDQLADILIVSAVTLEARESGDTEVTVTSGATEALFAVSSNLTSVTQSSDDTAYL